MPRVGRGEERRGIVSVEFEALWDALAQYVENTADVEDDLNERERAKLETARAMLERMDAAVQALAG